MIIQEAMEFVLHFEFQISCHEISLDCTLAAEGLRVTTYCHLFERQNKLSQHWHPILCTILFARLIFFCTSQSEVQHPA